MTASTVLWACRHMRWCRTTRRGQTTGDTTSPVRRSVRVRRRLAMALVERMAVAAMAAVAAVRRRAVRHSK